MAVAGHISPEEVDDSSIGIEMDTNDPTKAVVWIDQVEIELTYTEVCSLAAECRQIREQMERAMATHFYTRATSWSASHLIAREGTRTLCNREPSDQLWHLDPVVGHPSAESCKVCLRSYHKNK